MRGLEIKLLGACRSVTWGRDGGRLRLQPGAASLLAYLVLQREHPQPREVVAAAFWGELPTVEARRRLNTTLWRLRRVIEPAQVPRGTYLLVEPSGAMAFNGGSDASVDVARFEGTITPILNRPRLTEADARLLAGAVELYDGDLLEGAYDDWVIMERERMRELYIRALARLLTWHRGAGDPEAALRYGQAILDRDPLREDVHRAMIEIHAQMGSRALALRQYELCRRLLAGELGVEPLPETRAVAARIAAGPAPGAERTVRILDQLLRAETELRALADTLRSAADDLRASVGDGAETAETAR